MADHIKVVSGARPLGYSPGSIGFLFVLLCCALMPGSSYIGLRSFDEKTLRLSQVRIDMPTQNPLLDPKPYSEPTNP